METIKKLSASEVTNLWTTYLTNTMGQNVTQYFLNKTQDPELRLILEHAIEISLLEIRKSQAFLEKVNHPLPQKFSKEDVDMNAPAICTDNFTLIIKYSLTQAAHVVYSLSLSTSTRTDIRHFYEQCLNNCAQLYNQLADLVVKKGLHHPEIYLPNPGHIEKVSKQSYMAGWFADRRPVSSAEISMLVHNFKSTEFYKTFLISFAQVSPSEELRKHYHRGVDMYQKQLDVLQQLLTENDLPKLPTWESEITDCTQSPFSDRLMLFKTSLLTASISGRYGNALSSVMRKDLGTHFARLMAETLQYGEDTLNLMIERGFLDQFPMAQERLTVPSST